MSITDLSVFQAIKTKMRWHQSRQSVLAENVANADTPGYRASDLKKMSFGDAMAAQPTTRPVSTVVTNSRHMAVALSGNRQFGSEDTHQFEVRPSGNSVVLEEQMMKATANQLDFQAATSLYSRGLGMLKTAIGRS
ncbi:MAG: flagellar basal body rod protein FlgB [Stappiaceae bacterium]